VLDLDLELSLARLRLVLRGARRPGKRLRRVQRDLHVALGEAGRHCDDDGGERGERHG
jgi:hypothetical protein